MIIQSKAKELRLRDNRNMVEYSQKQIFIRLSYNKVVSAPK